MVFMSYAPHLQQRFCLPVEKLAVGAIDYYRSPLRRLAQQVLDHGDIRSIKRADGLIHEHQVRLGS